MKQLLTNENEASKSKKNEIFASEFLSIEDVMKLLGISKRSVYNLIYNGTLIATRLSYKVTIITRENFMKMFEENNYNKQEASIFSKKRKSRRKSANPTSAKVEKKEENHVKQTPKDNNARQERKLIDASAFKASVRGSFVSGMPDGTPLYTLAEICRKFKYTYGRFYDLRIQYNIPSVRVNRAIHFPVDIVDAAMAQEKERLGKDLSEHWYSCADIMRIYGLGKTQVRRFAETHNVRIKRCGHFNYYMKADWEEARKEAEEISVCTKQKRDY